MSYQCELVQVWKGHLYRTYDWVQVKDLEEAAAGGVPVENLPGLWTAIRIYRKILKD